MPTIPHAPPCPPLPGPGQEDRRMAKDGAHWPPLRAAPEEPGTPTVCRAHTGPSGAVKGKEDPLHCPWGLPDLAGRQRFLCSFSGQPQKSQGPPGALPREHDYSANNCHLSPLCQGDGHLIFPLKLQGASVLFPGAPQGMRARLSLCLQTWSGSGGWVWLRVRQTEPPGGGGVVAASWPLLP